MLDWNILSAIGILAGIIVFVRFVMPWLKKNNIEFYEEVKLALLVFGYVYREDKIKAISQTALEVVKSLEELSLTSDEKHYLAVDEVFRRLLDEFNIEIDDEQIIDVLVRIAVSQLPPTNNLALN